jgi:hypothetical protein
MELYKSECREIIRRFLARKLSFADSIAALDTALAGFMPILKPGELPALRALMFANNEIISKEMERRGPPKR